MQKWSRARRQGLSSPGKSVQHSEAHGAGPLAPRLSPGTPSFLGCSSSLSALFDTWPPTSQSTGWRCPAVSQPPPLSPGREGMRVEWNVFTSLSLGQCLCWGVAGACAWRCCSGEMCLLSPFPARLANFGFNLCVSLHAGGRGIGPFLPKPRKTYTQKQALQPPSQ